MNRIEAVPRAEVFLSKRRVGWAGLAAAVGCAAVCALPLLATIGIGGGAAAAIARIIRPGAELVAGGVIFVAALGFMAFRMRAKRRAGAQAGCSGSCAVPRASVSLAGRPLPSDRPAHVRKARFFFRERVKDAPIVCTGDLALARTQIDGYRVAFAHLVGTERLPGGFRWIFRAEAGLEAHLRRLAEREAGCCPFISYTLTRDGEHIVWEVGGGDGASSVVEEYFRLPQRLDDEPRPGPDVEFLKRVAGDAGLSFTADARPVNDVKGATSKPR